MNSPIFRWAILGSNVGRTSPLFDVESKVKLGRKGPKSYQAVALVQIGKNLPSHQVAKNAV